MFAWVCALNNAASNITEFDLNVWIETWAEPVLGRLLKLEEYYARVQLAR